MNAHVDQDAAAARRIGVFEARPVRIARRCLEDDRRTNPSLIGLLLGGCISGIEPAHEPHLKKGTVACDCTLNVSAFSQRQRQRLLTERRFARFDGGHRDGSMGVRRTDDHDRVDLFVADQIARVLVAAADAEFRGDGRRDRAIGVGHGSDARFRDPG